MSEKITGYFLLAAGLVVIILAAFNVYAVFTKQLQPINLFALKGIPLNISPYLPTDAIRPPPATSPTELFPASDLNFISNLTAHYLLMSFMIGVGAKISSLGIQLIRPIEVKLRATEPKSASVPGSSSKS